MVKSDIYHHFMLLLFIVAAWTIGVVTGATLVYHQQKQPTYLQAFRGK